MILLLLACLPEDVALDDSVPVLDDTAAASTEPLYGQWISDGADISPLFSGAPFEYLSIDAVFGDEGYEVVGHTADDDYTFAGTFTIDTSSTPASIELIQTQPGNAVARGIYLVEDEVLTYEVVQVEPDYGYAPPTPEEGFGSTTGPNLSEGDNVQVYRRP
ncbi:MAG TPA: hypothetical protein QGF58_03410 [Myxococcota bacterium]|nr:hypothetical protein [Myxococcota bacterium]